MPGSQKTEYIKILLAIIKITITLSLINVEICGANFGLYVFCYEQTSPRRTLIGSPEKSADFLGKRQNKIANIVFVRKRQLHILF